jgi:hypothetical protein
MQARTPSRHTSVRKPARDLSQVRFKSAAPATPSQRHRDDDITISDDVFPNLDSDIRVI